MVAKANACNINDVFVSCLLHDTENLFFYKKFPAATALADEKAACDSIALIDCEESVLGIDHVEAGSLIINSWHLGPSIGLAIQNHHRPYAKFSNDKLSCIVAFANQLAHQMEKPDDARYELDGDLANFLNLIPSSCLISTVLSQPASLPISIVF